VPSFSRHGPTPKATMVVLASLLASAVFGDCVAWGQAIFTGYPPEIRRSGILPKLSTHSLVCLAVQIDPYAEKTLKEKMYIGDDPLASGMLLAFSSSFRRNGTPTVDIVDNARRIVKADVGSVNKSRCASRRENIHVNMKVRLASTDREYRFSIEAVGPSGAATYVTHHSKALGAPFVALPGDDLTNIINRDVQVLSTRVADDLQNRSRN
jgi:hypothetical protein